MRPNHSAQCQGAAAARWLDQQEAVLLPVPYFHLVFTLPHALAGVFAAKYRDGLKALYDRGQLVYHGQLTAAATPAGFAALLREAARKPWVVYAKKPTSRGSVPIAGLAPWSGSPPCPDLADTPRRSSTLHEPEAAQPRRRRRLRVRAPPTRPRPRLYALGHPRHCRRPGDPNDGRVAR